MILAKTVKGYGLWEGGEGRNATHQQKKLTEPQIGYFYKRFEMNIPEEKVKKLDFIRPAEGSPESEYIKKRVEAMGGPLPARKVRPFRIQGARARSSSTNRLRAPEHEQLRPRRLSLRS